MKKIGLLQIIGDSSLSGAPISLLGLIKGLDKKKFDITCICPPGPLVEKLQSIKRVRVEPSLMKSKWDIKAVKTIRHIIKFLKTRNSKLIVHCHGLRGGWLGRLACIAPQKHAPKVVYTEHLWTPEYKLDNPLSNKLQIFVLWFLDLITSKTIAVSQVVADFLIQSKITRPEKIKVIYNGVEQHSFSKPKNTDKKSKEKIIGFVGSLAKRKGVEYLIRAVAEINKNKKRIPKISRVIIIGDGPEKEKLKNLSKKLKIDKIVEFKDSVAEPKRFYKEFDIYVQPSQNEAFGIAALEAMSFGLPVVASNVGGLSELLNLKEEKNLAKPYQITDCGVLVPPQNEKALAEAISRLLKDEKLAKEIGEGAQKRAKEFSIEKMVNETEKLYLSLVE